MPISIKNEETENLAREVAALTGESLTVAIRVALEERQQRLGRVPAGSSRLERMREIAGNCAGLARRPERSEDEILGYDENGIPAQPWLSIPPRC